MRAHISAGTIPDADAIANRLIRSRNVSRFEIDFSDRAGLHSVLRIIKSIGASLLLHRMCRFY